MSNLTSTSGAESWFDLSELSEPNGHRHRKLQLATILVVLSIEACFGALLWTVLVLSPYSAKYFVVSVGILVCLLIFSLGAYGYRFWATPPHLMRVAPGGLIFEMNRTKSRLVEWSDRNLEIQILDRSNDANVPQMERYRIWVRGSPNDRRLPWRHVVPFTYVTKEAVEGTIKSARSAGLNIRVDNAFAPISLVSHAPCTSLTIHRESIGSQVIDPS
jgi:hypothetical protein